MSVKAAELYNRAIACVPAVGWLRILASHVTAGASATDLPVDDLLDSNIEQIEVLFSSRGYALPGRFEKDAREILKGIESDDNSKAFEVAHRRLGELLGFESGNSESDSAPDPWWISNGQLCLVSEDKSDTNPQHSVPVRHTRQAASHPKWIKENVSLSPNAEIHVVMITPSTKVHREVPTYAEEVGWWHLDDFRTWARKAVAVMRSLRAAYSGQGNVAWRTKVKATMLENKLDPTAIVRKATGKLLRDVEVE